MDTILANILNEMRMKTRAKSIILFSIAACVVFAQASFAVLIAQNTDSKENYFSQGVNGLVNEVIVGRANAGPYNLGWTNIDADTVELMLNGRTLQKGSDYNIDPATGIVTFNRPLAADAIVRVAYELVPGKSKKSAGARKLPVEANLLERDDLSIKMTGLYAQDDKNNPEAERSVFGIVGDKKWSGGKFTSKVYATRDSRFADSDQEADNSAYEFAGEHTIGGLRFTGSLLRSGKDFTGARDVGLAQGIYKNDFSAEYAPADNLSISHTMGEEEITEGKKKGYAYKTSGQRLDYDLSDSTKMAFSRVEKDTRANENADWVRTESDVFRMDHRLSGSTTAFTTYENTRVVRGEVRDFIRKRETGVESRVSPMLSITGSHIEESSDSGGMTSVFSVNTRLTPAKTLSISADYTGKENTTAGEESVSNVSLATSPLSWLSITGKLYEKRVNDHADYSNEVALTGKPTANVDVTAGVAEKEIGGNETTETRAELAYKPYEHTKLATGYRELDTNGDVLRISDYQAETRPVKYISVTGLYRDREELMDEAKDTTNVQLSLVPAGTFTLSGKYQMNPEDKKGRVQETQVSAYDMDWRLGSVQLSASYSEHNSYGLERLKEEQDYRMAMPVFGSGKLWTGFKYTRMAYGLEQEIKRYELGYKHPVSRDFSFSLSGYYDEHMEGRVFDDEASDFGAETNVTVKF